jgi:TRAP-type C4-dicarboxylate transport system permease small subunit
MEWNTMNRFKRLVQIVAEICINIEMILLCIMTIMVFALVVSRYVFSYSFAWVEALSRYMMIWMAFLSAAVLFKDNSHLCMDIVYRKLSERMKCFLDLGFGLLQIAFLIMLAKLSIQYTQSVSFIVSPTLGISMFWPSLVMPVSVILMIFFILFRMITNLLELSGLINKNHNLSA